MALAAEAEVEVPVSPKQEEPTLVTDKMPPKEMEEAIDGGLKNNSAGLA